MRKIERPNYDDSAALDELANNKNLGSFPRLKRHVHALRTAYAQYIAANGDVSAVNTVRIPRITAGFLRGHYSSPPIALAHIIQMREGSDSNTCSMCGSLHSGTLDHLMDKENHPAFAIFAQNLVPACKCNSKRLKALVGSNPGERILHPYFDDVLNERIVSAHFTDLGLVPHVETRVILNQVDPHYPAAVFHHDSVVMRTSIHGYLARQWSKFMRRPEVIVPYLRQDPADRAELVAIIVEDRDRMDVLRDSKNNWDSIFRSGLLDNHVIDWLYPLFKRPGRPPNTPLI